MDWVKSLLSIGASLLSIFKTKQELNNAPEMKAAASGEVDSGLKDSAASAIAKQDEAEVRRRLSL